MEQMNNTNVFMYTHLKMSTLMSYQELGGDLHSKDRPTYHWYKGLVITYEIGL